jgi:hypothetical protein
VNAERLQAERNAIVLAAFNGEYSPPGKFIMFSPEAGARLEQIDLALDVLALIE